MTAKTTNKYVGIQGDADHWEDSIRLCGQALVEKGYVEGSFIDGCIEREKDYPTGLPSPVPVAIPHCKSEGIHENSICLLRLNKPVRFYRLDDNEEYIKAALIFNLAIKNSGDHLEYLQKLMALIMDEAKMKIMVNASMEEALKLLDASLL